eukprot:SAG31_NODE_706_length_12688_cov_41.991342_5_plen_107_part_00
MSAEPQPAAAERRARGQGPQRAAGAGHGQLLSRQQALGGAGSSGSSAAIGSCGGRLRAPGVFINYSRSTAAPVSTTTAQVSDDGLVRPTAGPRALPLPAITAMQCG